MIVEGYGRRRYKADYIRYLVYLHAECGATIVHFDFLFETGSLKADHETLSRKINSYINWVENNWNDFPANSVT